MASYLLLEDGSRIILEDGSGFLLMEQDVEIDAATELGPITSEAHLSSDRKHVDAAVALGPLTADPITELEVFLNFGIVADVALGPITAESDLDVFRQNSLDADVSLGSITGAADLLVVPIKGYVDYVETADQGLYGEIDLARGPGNTLLVSASDSRSLCYMAIEDYQRIYVARKRVLDARPLAVASDDGYHYVITEQAAEHDPDGQPELIVYPQTDYFADPVARERLPRDIQPRFLWAADDGPDSQADFIVLTGADGAVQIRKADPTLELLAEVGTGIYEPRVVEVVRQEDLERSDDTFTEYVWNVLIFSERSARGVVLQYRDRTQTTSYIQQEDVNISAVSELGPVTGAAGITINPGQLNHITGEAELQVNP